MKGKKKSTLNLLPLGLELQSLKFGSRLTGKLQNLFPPEIQSWQMFPLPTEETLFLLLGFSLVEFENAVGKRATLLAFLKVKCLSFNKAYI